MPSRKVFQKASLQIPFMGQPMRKFLTTGAAKTSNEESRDVMGFLESPVHLGISAIILAL